LLQFSMASVCSSWHEDRYLGHFGIKIDPNMTMTNTGILQKPEIQFDKAKLNPGTSGRWDLRGKKFLFGNPEPQYCSNVCIKGNAKLGGDFRSPAINSRKC